MTSYSEAGKAPIPPHVPIDRVVDFDYFNPPGLEDGLDVYQAFKSLQEGPDIQWTPRNGGHWIMTRAADMRWSRGEPNIFSRAESVLPAGSMNTLMPPTNVDPPYHARFRAVLNPYFTPGAIKRQEGQIRQLTIDLIEELKPKGRCEFVEDFGRIMPVIVFLNMLELPVERRGEFLEWGRTYINASDQTVKEQAAATVAHFLTTVLNDRQSNPRDDLFSNIANWRNNPRFKSEDEVIGMAMVSFLAGLDTVTGILSFAMWHLSTHPEARRRLIDEPQIIPRAVEEYFRRHGLANSGRLITQDIERDGIVMKQGDLLLVADALAGIDERAHADAMTIDFDRDSRVHDTFGGGVHRCIGEHLARSEMTIVLEEWMKRMPEFSVDPERPPKSYSGVVMGVSQLGLVWDQAMSPAL